MSSIESLIQDYLAAAQRGDWDGAFAYMAEDVVLNVPGRSRFAGRHECRGANREYLAAALAYCGIVLDFSGLERA